MIGKLPLFCSLIWNMVFFFFYKRFAFPVWFAQTIGTFVAHVTLHQVVRD